MGEKAYTKFLQENPDQGHFMGGRPREAFIHLTGWSSAGIDSQALETPQRIFGCDTAPEALYKLFMKEKRCMNLSWGAKAIRYGLLVSHSYAVRDVRRIDADNYEISIINPYWPKKEICFPLDENFIKSIYTNQITICPTLGDFQHLTPAIQMPSDTRPAASLPYPSAHDPDDEKCLPSASGESDTQPVGA